jgi:competence protein ComEC
MKLFMLGIVACFLMDRLWEWEQKVSSTEELCAFLALPRIKSLKVSPIKVRAQGQYSNQGQVELKVPEVFFKKHWQDFNGSVVVGHDLKVGLPEENKVEITGKFECENRVKNFSEIQDGIFGYRSRKLRLKKGSSNWSSVETRSLLPFSLGRKIRKGLQELLRPYPNLSGIVWAVWTGDARGLDPELVEMYRAGGLLPLVALSGQHVSVLVVMLRGLIGLFSNWLFCIKPIRDHYRLWDLILPTLASLLLTLSSQGTASVIRTLAMAMAICLLRLRRCLCSTTQIVCSSAALMIAIEPGLLTGISFVLSVAATFLLVEVSEAKSLKSSLGKYFFLSTVMALLSCPLILFYFGRWSYLAPVTTLCFSWLWNLLIIPVGFIVPTLALLPGTYRHIVLSTLDSGWDYLNSGQLLTQKMVLGTFYAYPRPTISETLVLQASCLILLQTSLSQKKEDDAYRFF